MPEDTAKPVERARVAFAGDNRSAL